MEGLNDIRIAISSKNIQLLQSYVATYRKKLEEVVFVEEEFLYKKRSKKDVYVDYGAKLQLSMQYGDLTIEAGETNYYSHVSQQPSFESFFLFSAWL